MGSASGKAILFGEHAVVYGRPAIATAIDRGVHTEARPAERDLLSVRGETEQTIPDDAETDERLNQAFDRVLALYPDTRSAARVDLRVELPGGAGLGCSAAMGVAVIAALDELYGVVRSAGQRAEASLAWERVFHGNPSGIDSMVSALGGMLFFRKGKTAISINPKVTLPVVIAHTGIASSTREMIDSVARQRTQDAERVERVFDGIESIVSNGRLAIEAGDLRAVGQLMDLNHSLLSSLMLSTVEIEELVGTARAHGALGAKLTGAGGGGSIVALARDEAHAHTICDALAQKSRFAFVTAAGAPSTTSERVSV